MKPLVVKIGGSLVETGRLREILAITARAQRPTVVVPGGGPFADAVRNAQAEFGFSDEAAHRMTLLAMHQTGILMTELEPRLIATETLAAMRGAWKERRVAVWMPAKLCERDKRIPRDWSITSDGLAARLAERLGGLPVVLVKVAAGWTGRECFCAGARGCRRSCLRRDFTQGLASNGRCSDRARSRRSRRCSGSAPGSVPGTALRKLAPKRRRPGASVLAPGHG